MEIGLSLSLTSNKGVGDPTLLWDLDFTAQTYRYNRQRYASVTDLPLTTFTRATTGYGVTAAGLLVPFASGVPRATDAGLTVEAAETSIDATSEGTGAWPIPGAGCTLAPSSRAGPNGSTSFYALVTQDSGPDRRAQTNFTVPNNSLPYYMSAFVPKLAGGAVCKVYMQLIGGTPVSATVNLNQTTGELVAGTGAVEDYGTAWRVSITATNNGTGNTLLAAQFYPSTNPAGTSSMEVGGLRVAQGSYPTSYYQTTTVPVTRNADVLVTADTVISPTIVAEFTTPSLTNYRTIFAHIGTSSTDAVLIYSNGTQIIARVNVGGISQAVLTLGSIVPNTVYKVAFRVVANDFAASLNGAVCVVDGAGTLPTVTTAYIGVENSSVNPWGAGIRKIKRYSTAKTNAELQALAA